MPSAAPLEYQREGLLKHLDGLFALAQVVTSNAESAVQLVEATFRRAFAQSGAPESDEERRVWLYHILLQIRDERAAVPAAAVSEGAAETGPSPDIELADFRQRLAKQFVDKHLPPAFAALPSEHRLLLMLCDVQRMSCADAGRVLALPEERACADLEAARIGLHRALYANATDAERHLLDTGLAGSWKRAALQRMAESELVALPPTLMPSIMADTWAGESSRTNEPVSVSREESERPDAMRLLKRIGAVALIIAIAGLLGYGFSSVMQERPNLSIITLSAEQARDLEVSFQTSSAEQAERFIQDRLGSRVTVPSIEQAVLEGVSIGVLAEGAEVPVLLYRNEVDDSPVTVYVYSYAFLDRHEATLEIDRGILNQIEEEGRFDLHDRGEEKVLIWRKRDDIMLAITAGDAEELRQRIAYPS